MTVREKTITINNKPIILRELTVRQIRKVMDDQQTGAFNINDTLALCTSATLEALEDMTPSEIMSMWKEFQAMNADFFRLLDQAGVPALLRQMLQKTLTEAFAGLSLPDMGKLPGTMAAGSSDAPLTE